jgi:hypothetical protein
MRAPMSGRLRKTLGSVSISVDTARPLVGHLIITELIRSPPTDSRPTYVPTELADLGRLKTAHPLVDNVSVIEIQRGTKARGAALGPVTPSRAAPPLPPE